MCSPSAPAALGRKTSLRTWAHIERDPLMNHKLASFLDETNIKVRGEALFIYIPVKIRFSELVLELWVKLILLDLLGGFKQNPVGNSLILNEKTCSLFSLCTAMTLGNFIPELCKDYTIWTPQTLLF